MIREATGRRDRAIANRCRLINPGVREPCAAVRLGMRIRRETRRSTCPADGGTGMAAAASTAGGGGIFLLFWGAFATVMGGLLVTNFRGFARWSERGAEASTAWLRRVPPWRWLPDHPGPAGQRWLSRLIGGIFAVTGPVVFVLGVILVARGQGGSLFLHVHRPSGPSSYLNGLIAAGWLIRFWRPRGHLATAWSQGGTARRTLALISSIAVLGYPVTWWFGLPILGVACLVIGSLAALAVFSPLSRRVGTRDQAER